MTNFEKIKNGSDKELALILAHAYIDGIFSNDDDPPSKEDIIDIMKSENGKEIFRAYLIYLRKEASDD